MLDHFFKPHSEERGLSSRYAPRMKQVLRGLAVTAVVGTIGYLTWIGALSRLFALLFVFVAYLPPLYCVLYLLVQKERTDTIALLDRICATLTAIGGLVGWGWYVTVPMTPQNAQAPIGLFMLGWTGPAAFYGTVKIVLHEYRRLRDG